MNMRKIAPALALLAALLLGLSLSAAAADKVYVIDETDTLSAKSLADLNVYAKSVSAQCGLDVAFLLAAEDYEDGGQNLRQYAETRYREANLGRDGVMLAICPGVVWSTCAFGRGEALLTNSLAEALYEPYGDADTYSGGIRDYLSLAAELLAPAVEVTTVPATTTPATTAPAATEPAITLPVRTEPYVYKELIIDKQGLIPAAELVELNDRANAISEQYGTDIAFLLAADSYKERYENLREYAYWYYFDKGETGEGLFIFAICPGDAWSGDGYGRGAGYLHEVRRRFYDAYAAVVNDGGGTYTAGINAYLDAVIPAMEQAVKLQASAQANNLRRVATGERLPRLVDDKGLLAKDEAAQLLVKLDEISLRQQFDVTVVVVDALDGREAHVYALDFYEQNGYGHGPRRDGAILLLATADRDFGFASTGYGMVVFTSTGQDYLDTFFLPDLKEDRYYEAFMAFADAVDLFVTQANTGEPYRKGNIPLTLTEKIVDVVMTLLTAGGLALFIAWAVTKRWKRQLVTVHKQTYARAYIRDGSMKLIHSGEEFLHRHVSQTERATESSSSGGGGSSFSSSSGGGGTGHSGKY